MKITLRIARNELASLFFSPIAWFILIVFSFFCAKYFCTMVDSDISFFSLHGNSGGSVTQSLFMDSTSVWNDIVTSLYIYIPLLTMGLLSREFSSGSIKLLYSSPVTSFQIVSGKFIAAVVFGSCMLIVPILEVLISGLLYVPNFDWAPVLVGLLGVFLLMCVYCSIGLFMSSLTSYQVVAAIGTLALLAGFRFVGQIGQEYDFVRELTYWLSINGRTDQFIGGILRSEDLVYFIAVIGMFLAFTTLRIWFSRKSTGRITRAMAYAGVVVVTLVVGYATSRPQTVAVWDATRTKSNSLTAYSQELLSDIKGPLTITNYVNLLDNKSSRYLPSRIKSNEALFAPYRLAKPDLYEKYVYYYAETPGNSLAHRPKYMDKTLEELRDYMVLIMDVNPYLFLTPEEINEVEDLSGEEYQFVRIVETADGRRAYLRDFNDMICTPGEAEISAVLKKMTAADVPSVAFISTSGSREVSRPGDRDYGAFSIEKYSRAALVNQGFDVCEIDLDAGEEIPDNVSIIVLGDPRRELSESARTAIEEYLDRGGNMFLLTDTGQQDNINRLLSKFGLKALDGQLAQVTDDFTADFVLAECAEPAGTMPRSFVRRFAGSGRRVSMPGCVALDTIADSNGFERTVWLQTPSEKSWIELESTNLRDDLDVSCNKDAGEEERSYATLIAAERKIDGKTQRILVSGDADCMSNAELQIGREGFESGNFDLVVEGFRYLSGGEFPIAVSREANIDTAFSTDAASVAGVMKIVLMIVLPALMILLGVGLQLLRGKK